MKTRVQEFSWGNWNFQVQKWFAEEKKKALIPLDSPVF